MGDGSGHGIPGKRVPRLQNQHAELSVLKSSLPAQTGMMLYLLQALTGTEAAGSPYGSVAYGDARNIDLLTSADHFNAAESFEAKPKAQAEGQRGRLQASSAVTMENKR